ncbi:MAG: hypothetical protein HPY61_12830 [Methanotrichaceae archaeon]|nr:hypothetical protein [Methanotrichaceae archaeon]
MQYEPVGHPDPVGQVDPLGHPRLVIQPQVVGQLELVGFSQLVMLGIGTSGITYVLVVAATLGMLGITIFSSAAAPAEKRTTSIAMVANIYLISPPMNFY